jgi:hypothetical protein
MVDRIRKVLTLLASHIASIILVVLAAQAILPVEQSLDQSLAAAVFVALWMWPLTAFIHLFHASVR